MICDHLGQTTTLSRPPKGQRSTTVRLTLPLLATFFFGVLFGGTVQLKSFFPAQEVAGLVAFRQEENDGTFSLSSLERTIVMSGDRQKTSSLRILVAVVNYGGVDRPRKEQEYMEQMLDSYNDLCLAVARVTVVLYTSKPYPPVFIDRLQSRACSEIQIVVKNPSVGLTLVDYHRQLFYDRINNYDLFVYTEDDHWVRTGHIVSYVRETARLRQLVGDQRFSDYSIGFMRFEINRKTHQRVVFEQKRGWVTTDVQHPGIQGRYFTTLPPHHQGLFMATPTQLSAWATRCQFDQIGELKGRPEMHREHVSSLHLFDDKVCNVTQLFPLDTFEDFTVQHLANYKHRFNSNLTTSYGQSIIKTMDEIQDLRLSIRQQAALRLGTDIKSEFPTTKITMTYEESEPMETTVEEGMKKYRNYVNAKKRQTVEKSQPMAFSS